MVPGMTTKPPADATRVVVDFLQQRIPEPVVTKLEEAHSAPIVKVQRAGGSPVPQEFLHLDRAQISIECFGKTAGGTEELAGRVRAAMADLRHNASVPVARVIHGQHRTETRGDRAPYIHRTQSDFLVHLHPNP